MLSVGNYQGTILVRVFYTVLLAAAINIIVASTAAATTTYTSKKIIYSWLADAGLGYSWYDHGFSGRNNTANGRFAIGGSVNFTNYNLQLGMEVGVQSGIRYLNSDTTLASSYHPFNIRPLIDVLAIARFKIKKTLPFLLITKAGIAYRQYMPDFPSTNSQQKIDPEIQAGIGWTITQRCDLTLSYQRIFGNGSLTDIGQGYGKLKGIPTQQGVIAGLSIYL